MERLNITKGECKVEEQSNHQLAITIGGKAICFLPRFQENVSDNATLLSDSITTYNTTPILPSELLKQRNELLKALTRLYDSVDSCVELTPEVLHQALRAIKNANQK